MPFSQRPEKDFERPEAFEEDYEPQSHIFHKLMQFKVKRILLVSSLYDAFIIEEEGLIPELVIGEYSHLDLSSPPHVFRVSSGGKALEKIAGEDYDLVITMSKNIGMDPFEFGSEIKKLRPGLPVVLLATDTSDLYEAGEREDTSGIDKVFFWNGDSNLFIAIIKFIEDRVNVEFDTVHGNVQAIILVEDSVRYYSMFLPIIYSELVQQTQILISEDLNEMQRRLRMRVRPKVLMAETYEEALYLYTSYRHHVLGIISDVNYKRESVHDKDAGYSLLRAVREKDIFIPILLQSTKEENRVRSEEAGAYFLHKKSPLLLQDFRHFLLNHLGFGDFIFLLPQGTMDDQGKPVGSRSAQAEISGGEGEERGMGWEEVSGNMVVVDRGKEEEEKREMVEGAEKGKMVGEEEKREMVGEEVKREMVGEDRVNEKEGQGHMASGELTRPKDWLHDSTIELGRTSDMREFEQLMQRVPIESILFHAERQNFSNWLMARGEFRLARKLRPRKVTEFRNSDAIRDYLITVFKESRREKQYGIITDFKRQTFEFESSFSRLGGGSLGGKGRGIAFIRSILTRYNIRHKYRDVSITIPNTVVIATDEFDRFMKANDLRKFTKLEDIPDEEIAETFLNGELPEETRTELRRLLEHFCTPLAVRSSSLLEDSQNYPFAGIYSTYMLPNNHHELEVRLEQLCRAVKLVYASMFYSNARTYIMSTASRVEEEKMAVVIQEVVGKDHNGRFYPNFSGVAQSYNFYPVSHQSYEDGIVSLAVGLGKSVVGGEKVIRFSPRYPELIPEFSNADAIFNNSQKSLYVIDMENKEFELTVDEESTLKRLDVVDIEKDGTLDTIASTFDRNSGMIRDSMDFDGPHLVTFAGILKYRTMPLAPLLNDLLNVGERSMGCPVEIEFAVNIDQISAWNRGENHGWKREEEQGGKRKETRAGNHEEEPREKQGDAQWEQRAETLGENLIETQEEKREEEPREKQGEEQRETRSETQEENQREKPTFSILQIRPIVIPHEHCDITHDLEGDRESVFIHSDMAMGNGQIANIRDIVYVPHEVFEPSQTVAMAREVGEINRRLALEKRPYLLMGPGRWGTEDAWLGIPVAWEDISGVKIIVETSMENFNIEPSQGTHFFQNMISRKIGYISIPFRGGEWKRGGEGGRGGNRDGNKDSFVDWEWLEGLPREQAGKFFRIVSLASPLVVKLDGTCGGALLLKNQDPSPTPLHPQ